MPDNRHPRRASRRFLVLGSNGFIGRAVVEVLAQNPAVGEVVGLVRAATPHDQGTTPTWAVDLRDISDTSLGGVIDDIGPQVVVNAVGSTSGDEATMEALNVELVARLLRVLRARPGIRMVQVGSAAEYGLSEPGRPVRETDPCVPLGPYGRTKLQGTRLVVEATSRGEVDATVLRVFNPIGPGAPRSTLLGRATDAIIHAIHHQEPAIELGPLSSYRDYVDVRDVAWAVLATGVRSTSTAGLFNIARGHAVQSRLLVKMLARIADYEGPIIETEDSEHRSGGLVWQEADIGAAQLHLPWSPRYSIADAVVALWNDRLAACGT